jgi:hypothetical protein
MSRVSIPGVAADMRWLGVAMPCPQNAGGEMNTSRKA